MSSRAQLLDQIASDFGYLGWVEGLILIPASGQGVFPEHLESHLLWQCPSTLRHLRRLRRLARALHTARELLDVALSQEDYDWQQKRLAAQKGASDE